MFRSVVNEEKRRERSFSAQGLPSYTEQHSKARTGSSCSGTRQTLLRPPSGFRAKSTYRPQGYPFP